MAAARIGAPSGTPGVEPSSLNMLNMTMSTRSLTHALNVHYERWEAVHYTTKDGTQKKKKDFVSRSVPFSEFKAELSAYWPKFILHHNDAKWHDDDFIALKARLPRGHAALVIDYAENYTHEPHFENQSKYFSQVSYGLHLTPTPTPTLTLALALALTLT